MFWPQSGLYIKWGSGSSLEYLLQKWAQEKEDFMTIPRHCGCSSNTMWTFFNGCPAQFRARLLSIFHTGISVSSIKVMTLAFTFSPYPFQQNQYYINPGLRMYMFFMVFAGFCLVPQYNMSSTGFNRENNVNVQIQVTCIYSLPLQCVRFLEKTIRDPKALAFTGIALYLYFAIRPGH